MIDWDVLVLSPVMGIFGEGQDQAPVYTPRGGTAFTLPDAVFDRQFLAVTVAEDGSEVSSRMPVLGVRLAACPVPPAQGDRVTIPSIGATYMVREVQADGHGHAKLLLNLVSPTSPPA